MLLLLLSLILHRHALVILENIVLLLINITGVAKVCPLFVLFKLRGRLDSCLPNEPVIPRLIYHHILLHIIINASAPVTAANITIHVSAI